MFSYLSLIMYTRVKSWRKTAIELNMRYFDSSISNSELAPKLIPKTVLPFFLSKVWISPFRYVKVKKPFSVLGKKVNRDFNVRFGIKSTNMPRNVFFSHFICKVWISALLAYERPYWALEKVQSKYFYQIKNQHKNGSRSCGVFGVPYKRSV